jgi:hypothetical protein
MWSVFGAVMVECFEPTHHFAQRTKSAYQQRRAFYVAEHLEDAEMTKLQELEYEPPVEKVPKVLLTLLLMLCETLPPVASSNWPQSMILTSCNGLSWRSVFKL